MRRIILCISLISFLGSCSTNKSASTQTGSDNNKSATSTQSVTYQNPVLPGDYADPSVIRVGNDYWATATSSEWAPLFPILHSKNLIDWETVGHVFPDKLPGWADKHFWAPEITYDKGKYYIYYTASKKGGNLCVGVASASKPTGPYTDLGALVCQEVGSIDGFPIRDEKGELYLIWKEDANSVRKPTPIWGQRMSEDRTALTGEKFELFRNEPGTWEGGLVEGPALIKRDDYFYMFYAGDACCGRGCTYGVGVARSKKITGPWEKYANNPIMQKNETWKCPGHGSVVSDQNGRDFFLYHAYSTKGFVYPGRQGLLDEIIWGSDGWPSFKDRSPSVTAQVPFRNNAPDIIDVRDEFTQASLANTWQWPVNNWSAYNITTKNNGQLLLKASPEKIGTILGQRTKAENYTATTTLSQRSLANGVQAGLTAIGDPNNAIGIALQDGQITLWSVRNNRATTIGQVAAPGADIIHFRLQTSAGDKMQFAWSTNGQDWNSLNNDQPVNGDYLPPWDRGVRVGLTVKGPTTASAAFDKFELTHN